MAQRRIFSLPVAALLAIGMGGLGVSNPVTAQAADAVTPTVTITSSPATPGTGGSVTFSVVIAPPSSTTNAPAPTGTVVLTLNGAAAGTANVIPGTNTSTATLAITAPAAGTYAVVATYSGDANYTTASATLTLTVSKIATTLVLTAATTAQPGTAIVLTATVTAAAPSTDEPNPTGTVVFYNGTKAIGTATLVPAPPSGSPSGSLAGSSTATLTLQTLPGGQATLTAYYQGDSYYAASTSAPLTITVPGFTLTAAPTNPATNLNIVQGSSGSVSFIVAGQGGFTGQVQVECYAPPQDNMTCTATPQQVTPTATVTFVVSTSTGSLVQTHGQPLWPRAAGGTALAALIFFLLPWGRRTRTLLRRNAGRALVLALLLVGLAGAGIGCTSNKATTVSGATPLGVATLKVTAQAYVDNAVVSQSLSFTVNVQAPGSI